MFSGAPGQTQSRRGRPRQGPLDCNICDVYKRGEENGSDPLDADLCAPGLRYRPIFLIFLEGFWPMMFGLD